MIDKVLLTVSYDGTRYAGWQRQKNALSVQQVLEEALGGLIGGRVKVAGGGRTDAGVHATGQRALITEPDSLPIPAGKIHLAVNARLPEDIRAVASASVPEGFHPIRSSVSKTYAYTMCCEPVQHPVHSRYSAHVRGPLDLRAMRAAAACFVGEHDFAGFCSTGGSAATTVRRITEADVTERGGLVTFTVTGNGFLYNMVRIIAGTLLLAGQGRLSPRDVPGVIDSRDRNLAGVTMPAKGLILVEIRY